MTGAPPPPPPPPPFGGNPPPPPPGPSVPPPGYPPNFGAAAVSRNGLAIASLVLGIVSIPMCFLFLPALLAVIFGAIALSQIKGNPGQAGRGQAIAGIVLGGISLAFIIVAIFFAESATFQFESSLPAVF